MIADAILWGHALAAMLFGALGLWLLRHPDAAGLPRAPLTGALLLTALWSLSVAGIGADEVVTTLFAGLRTLAWLVVMLLVQRRERERAATLPLAYGAVAALIAGQVVLSILSETMRPPQVAADMLRVSLTLQALAAVSALVLLHGLFSALQQPSLRIAMAAVGAMWLIDANLVVVGIVSGETPGELLAVRGLALALLAGVFALGLNQMARAALQVSRTATMHSLSVLALVAYAGAMMIGTSVIGAIGGPQARALQTALVFGATATLLTLMSSSWLRAWVRVKLSKHLFRHRYDYRVEWARFTETLGRPHEAAPLAERVVQALADLTASPAGMLLMAGGDGLERSAFWKWPDAGTTPEPSVPLAQHLAETGRVIELDAVRRGTASAADAAAVPTWMLDLPGAWVLVPLPHLDQMVGAILLGRPPIDRSLDWEDFDLLKIAGRQVASYLAEARAQEALLEAQRFDEFNRRFAFILHDIKNLVSQLALLARNAERHADNPAFRADMVATLRESAGRMNDLLARLSQRQHVRGEAPRAIDLVALANGIATARRAQHPVQVEAEAPVLALADPGRLEQLLGHLVQNAVEASERGSVITLRVARHEEAAAIEVIDRGCGMSAAFVRERLFKPFVSSKPGGFGIGAFEAGQLAAGMGGRIEVSSREGQGSTFRIVLPSATPAGSTLEQAA